MKEKSINLIITGLLILITASFSGCGGEADTVDPDAVSQSVPGSLTGTIYPQIISVYPANASTDIPVDTDIVIVFSKPILSGSISGQVSIDGGETLDTAAPVLVSGLSAVILDVSSAPLAYGTTYTVTIGTGITDTDGNALSSGTSFSFTTAADSFTSLQPKVIAATRYPISPSVPGISQSYVEVTFTDEVDNVTNTTFKVLDSTLLDVSTLGAPYSSDNKTWRIDIDTALAEYSMTYTATLTTAIYKLGDPTSTLINSNLVWSYTAETDPDLVVTSVTAIWVSSVTDTTATIKFFTSKPVELNDCYAVYDTTAGVTNADTHVVENAAATLSTLHTVTVPLLTPLTRYYFIAGVDTTGDGVVDTVSSEINFYTATNDSGTVNSTLTAAALEQNELQLLQTNGLGSYAFWVSNSSTIYGQYFNTAAGAPEWTDPGGEPISTFGGQNGLIAITDGFAEVVLVYNDSDDLYAKMVYDSAGTFTFRWGGGAVAQGTDLGLAIKSGSSYSACIVHERPEIISSGVADMPDNGDALNLLYDVDTDFSVYNAWLDVNDLLITDIANAADIIWSDDAINLQNFTLFDQFPYVLKSTTATPGLLVHNGFYITDIDVTIAGSADVFTATNQLCSTATNLLSVSVGDIIRTSDGEWGLASAAGAWSGTYFYVDIDRNLTGLSGTETFTIYTNHAGPFTSELVTNPLWDTAPSTLFDPNSTVLAGDFAVNENDNTAAASSATVTAINLAIDTDYALRLTADIMDDGDIYSIVRLPSGAAGVAVGYSTNFATNFNLTDGFGPFGAVNPGDIVFNIDQNLSAMVTSAAAGSLTLTADIFNAVNDKAIIYTKRGFLVTYVDTSDYIRARAFNIATGAPLAAAFNVCTDGANSNPVAVTDGAGNALIFYQKSGNIYAKKVSAKGEFLWAAPADTAGGTGQLLLSIYTIVQVLPEAALGSTGGAYLLAKNTAGTAFRLLRINGATGATDYDTTDVTGVDPQMAVDTVTGADRVIVVSRNTHLSGGVNYYHIEARAYRAGLIWSNLAVSDNTAAAGYNCQQPSITLADNTAGTDGIYVSWFDGRYYNPSGYSIFAQRLDTGGTDQWTAYGVLVSTPGSMGDFDHTLYMRLLYYNDGGSPYGVMPIWLDYRNYSGTGADIYYEQIVN